METKRPEVKLIDGYTESVWKSLAVKSIRMGWPAGYRAAILRLSPGIGRAIAWGQVYEDIFPAIADMNEVGLEIHRGDWDALCARETHHGRGLTQRFFDLRRQACARTDDPEWQRSQYAHLKQVAPQASAAPRVLNCVWTWLAIAPADAGIKRAIDSRPFTGMLEDAIDGHTYEGKITKRHTTLLSGSYEQHLEISKIVEAEGWDAIRTSTHSRVRRAILRPEQGALF